MSDDTFSQPLTQVLEEQLPPELIALDALKSKLFMDQNGTAYCQIPLEQSSICVPVRSKRFRAYLRSMFLLGAKRSQVNQLLNDLEDLALASGRNVKLHTRVAYLDGTIYIDLANDSGEMIEVDTNGYRKILQIDPIFYRHQHQDSLPVPIDEKSPEALFTHLGPLGIDDRRLVLAFLLTAWFPTVEPPICTLIGPQGSAKSTRTTNMRLLIDPSKTPSINLPELNEVPIILEQNALVCFENVATIPRSMADALCRASTGSGTQRRQLFTDDSIKLFVNRRPIIINGIEQPSQRPDFLDRTLTIHCERLSSFEPREQFEQRLKEVHPKIFGFLLWTLSKVMIELPKQEAKSEFRMASFVRFGCAVSAALGEQPKDFINSYRKNIRGQCEDLLDTDELSRLLRDFASSHTPDNPWTGTIASLRTKLEELALVLGIAGTSITKSLTKLSSNIREIAPLLSHSGVSIAQLPRTKDSRPWQISMRRSINLPTVVRLSLPTATDEPPVQLENRKEEGALS